MVIKNGNIVDALVEKVRAALATDIDSAIASALGLRNVDQTDDDAPVQSNGHAATYRRTVNRIEGRARRVQNPSKVYARNYTGRKMDLALFNTASKVWNAIVSADKRDGRSLSARELEKATGLSKKTVESCIWYLRNHDDNGVRVKPGKRALVVSADYSE